MKEAYGAVYKVRCLPDDVLVVGQLLQEHDLPEGPLQHRHINTSAPQNISSAAPTSPLSCQPLNCQYLLLHSNGAS